MKKIKDNLMYVGAAFIGIGIAALLVTAEESECEALAQQTANILYDETMTIADVQTAETVYFRSRCASDYLMNIKAKRGPVPIAIQVRNSLEPTYQKTSDALRTTDKIVNFMIEAAEFRREVNAQ